MIAEKTTGRVRIHLDGRNPGNNTLVLDGMDITRLVLSKSLCVELRHDDVADRGRQYPVVRLELAPEEIELTGDHVELLTQIVATKTGAPSWRQRRRIRRAIRRARGNQ
jgi:hypothetical protein